MVAFIPRTRATLGEQLGAGFQRGAEQGLNFGQQILGKKIEAQAEKKAISDKLAMLGRPEYADFFKGLDSQLANLAKGTIAGLINPGVATELAKMISENKKRTSFQDEILRQQMEGMGGEAEGAVPAPKSSTMPQGEMIPGVESFLGGKGQSTTEPVANVPPKKTPQQRNFDKEIANKQRLLSLAPDKATADQLSSEISELQNLRNLENKKTETSQSRAYERNKEYFKKINEQRSGLKKKKVASSQIRSALKSGNFESYRNKVGEYLGLKFAKDASAQIVDSAAKEYLVGTLGDITGRPNMFIEQSISKAMVNPLYQKEANEIILDGFELLDDLTAKEVEISDHLEDLYTKDGGEVPRNFAQLVQNHVDEYANDKIAAYEKKVDELLNKEKKPENIYKKMEKVVPGTPITPEIALKFIEKAGGNKDDAMKMAKEAGYEF